MGKAAGGDVVLPPGPLPRISFVRDTVNQLLHNKIAASQECAKRRNLSPLQKPDKPEAKSKWCWWRGAGVLMSCMAVVV